MDAADPGWRRLGAVLVEAGLVSEHDLVEALAEQERSGQRLGEVLVERGLVSAAAIANALAEQRGGFLKSEYGFGTGLRALMGQTSVPESDAAQPEVPPLSPTQPPELVQEDTPAVAVDSGAEAERLEAEPGAVPEESRRSVRGRRAHRQRQPRRRGSSEQQRRDVVFEEAQRQPHQISATPPLCADLPGLSAPAAQRSAPALGSSGAPRHPRRSS
jgi:hypothetical protein